MIRAVVVLAIVLVAAPAHADRRWRARVSIDAFMKHTSARDGETVTNKRQTHGSFEVLMSTADDEITGDAWSWSTIDKVIGASGSMIEEQIVVHEGHTETIRFEGMADASQIALSCLYDRFTWRCTSGTGFAGKTTYLHGGKVIESTPGKKAAPSLFQKGGKGSAVSKNGERFIFTNDVSGQDTHQHVTISIDPLEKSGVEAVFVMGPDYETFVPEGPSPTKPAVKGNSLDLHIELRDARTHKPSAKNFSAALTLDASKLPGTCMNFPPYGAPSPDEPDLYFKGGSDDTHFELAMGKGSGKVTVYARDYGGYAKLSAHVKVADGTELDVTTTEGAGSIDIPKDDNANHIADAWEKAKNLEGSTSSDADDESRPSGMNREGDGFTLFEEYRGFVQADPKGPLVIRPGSTPALIHDRLYPNQRDLLVGLAIEKPEDDAIVLSGLAAFAAMTSLHVVYIPSAEVTGPLEHDYSARFHRQVDFRSDSRADLFAKPQAGIWIASGLPSDNNSPAHADSIHGYGKKVTEDEPDSHAQNVGSPRDIQIVMVSRDNAMTSVRGMICLIDPDCETSPASEARTYWEAQVGKLATPADRRKKAASARANPRVLAERLLRFTIMHELGHAIGAYHHGHKAWTGAPTCPMRYWHGEPPELLAFIGGTWNVTTAPDGSPWDWCAENLPQLRLRDE